MSSYGENVRRFVRRVNDESSPSRRMDMNPNQNVPPFPQQFQPSPASRGNVAVFTLASPLPLMQNNMQNTWNNQQYAFCSPGVQQVHFMPDPRIPTSRMQQTAPQFYIQNSPNFYAMQQAQLAANYRQPMRQQMIPPVSVNRVPQLRTPQHYQYGMQAVSMPEQFAQFVPTVSMQSPAVNLTPIRMPEYRTPTASPMDVAARIEKTPAKPHEHTASPVPKPLQLKSSPPEQLVHAKTGNNKAREIDVDSLPIELTYGNPLFNINIEENPQYKSYCQKINEKNSEFQYFLRNPSARFTTFFYGQELLSRKQPRCSFITAEKELSPFAKQNQFLRVQSSVNYIREFFISKIVARDSISCVWQLTPFLSGDNGCMESGLMQIWLFVSGGDLTGVIIGGIEENLFDKETGAVHKSRFLVYREMSAGMWQLLCDSHDTDTLTSSSIQRILKVARIYLGCFKKRCHYCGITMLNFLPPLRCITIGVFYHNECMRKVLSEKKSCSV